METKIILDEVLAKITPSIEEKTKIARLANSIKIKLINELERAGMRAEVRIEGSVAKRTWISGDPDIDIFMLAPIDSHKNSFGREYLEAAKKATFGYQQIERYAEHPYLECIIKNVRVNIVPCYKVKKGKWKSSTDRTPFHTIYLKKYINEKLSGEIRLLKKFMKGIEAYGAEIKVGGFSGYLCELLILYYGSFEKALRSATEWKFGTTIDLEGYYRNEKEKLERFKEPLIVIDPVDKRRNVAAAVTKNKLSEFVAASRGFFDNPSIEFFYPTQEYMINNSELPKILKKRGSAIIMIRIENVRECIPDILWGQIQKASRKIARILLESDFNVIRNQSWSNDRDLSILVFELDSLTIPSMRKHLGPPLDKKEECKEFLKKHSKSQSTISGPRIEGNRWVVEKRRRVTNASDLLFEKINNRDSLCGMPKLISKVYQGSMEVLSNKRIHEIYSSIPEFALFFTGFLRGCPKWLR